MLYFGVTTLPSRGLWAGGMQCLIPASGVSGRKTPGMKDHDFSLTPSTKGIWFESLVSKVGPLCRRNRLATRSFAASISLVRVGLVVNGPSLGGQSSGFRPV